MRRVAATAIVLAVLAAGGAEGAHGQTPVRPPGARPGPEPVQDRAELERRIQARFEDRIRRELRLDPEDGARLREALAELRARRLDLRRDEVQLRERIRASPRAALPEAEALGLLEAMARLRLREAELFRDEQRSLLEILSPVQVVTFYRLRDELGEQVRRVRMRIETDRFRRGGRRPPRPR